MLTSSKPVGLRYLYVAIAGHAFAWYTLYNLFVFWLCSKGLSEGRAQAQYGNLVFAGYMLPLLGGFVASHFGPRRTAILGGCLAMLGYAAITYSDRVHATLPIMLMAVGLVTLGVGLSKPNIAALVGRMFPNGSTHADRAYAIYYSSINIGAVSSPLIGGYLSEHVSYGTAFAVAVLGEAVVVAALLLGRKALMVAESPSSLVAALGPVEVDGQVTLPTLPGTMSADNVGQDSNRFRAQEMDQLKRRKLIALWLFFAVAAFGFWPAYSQNGSGLSLWAQGHTNRLINGFQIPAAWFAAINSIICIVVTVPLLRLFKRAPLSMSTTTGYLLMAASFIVLLAAPEYGAHSAWLVGSIVLSSLSEVLISTIGLAQVAKLAPRHQTSTYMALWMLTTAIGGKLAGMIGERLQLLSSFALFVAVAIVAAAVTLACRSQLDLRSEPSTALEPVTV